MKHIYMKKMQEIEKENLNIMVALGERSRKELMHRGRGAQCDNKNLFRIGLVNF